MNKDSYLIFEAYQDSRFHDAKLFSIQYSPNENGMFDARRRLEVFGKKCVELGLAPFLGNVSTMPDAEVDRLVSKYGLDTTQITNQRDDRAPGAAASQPPIANTNTTLQPGNGTRQQ
jgi:hypothetical protein